MPKPTAAQMYDAEVNRIDRCQKPVSTLVDGGVITNELGIMGLAMLLPHALNHAAYAIAVQIEEHTAQLSDIATALDNIADALRDFPKGST